MTERPDQLVQRTALANVAAAMAAVLVAIGAFWLSRLLVPGLEEPVSFGAQWRDLSVDPSRAWRVAAPGEVLPPCQFPHRILGPALAWLLGLGGEGWMSFVRGLNVAMLAAAFFVCWRRGGALIDGALVALAIALTAAVQSYKEAWVGYVDPLCYTLFFCSMLTTRWPLLFWALWLANLFNHELAGFLLPWLWWLRRRQDGRWRSDLVGIAAAMVVYGAFYLWLRSRVQSTYVVDYFWQHPLFPGGSLAVWALAAVHWVVSYGPVLAVLAWHQHRREHGAERWHLWLVLLGIVTIFGIAFDWSRHSNLIVLPMVVAAAGVLPGSWRNRAIFAALIALGAGLMTVWPPWSASSWPSHEMAMKAFETGVVIDLDQGPGVDFGFGPISTTISAWLPAVGQWLWPVAAIGAAIWALGFALAKWLPARRS